MTELRNPAREKLAAGELAIGIGLRQARTVDIAKAMKTCGLDWLFIDMEHNSMDLDMAVQISVAAQDAGIAPIVRVPGFQHFHATRVLDGGALGVVVPHVDDAETARKMVDNCRYPPVGHRSVTGRLPQFGFAPVPLAESTRLVNEATLLVVMLETPTAVENCEDIAAVDGVDVLLMGTNDLCMEMGIPGQVGDPRIAGIFERVVAACRANGKWAGLGGVYEPALMQQYIGLGMQFILMGNDLPLLMEITAQRTGQLRELAR